MLSKSLFGALLAFAIADAALADTSAERDIKLTGDAMIYGGDIGDPVGPTPGDAKAFLNVTGKAAHRMFEMMGRSADQHGECVDPAVATRAKGDLTCMHDKDGYTCYLGFNLATGKSIASSTC